MDEWMGTCRRRRQRRIRTHLLSVGRGPRRRRTPLLPRPPRRPSPASPPSPTVAPVMLLLLQRKIVSRYKRESITPLFSLLLLVDPLRCCSIQEVGAGEPETEPPAVSICVSSHGTTPIHGAVVAHGQECVVHSTSGGRNSSSRNGGFDMLRSRSESEDRSPFHTREFSFGSGRVATVGHARSYSTM